MSKVRDFAILVGSIIIFAIILAAVERFLGFKTAVWAGFIGIFCALVALGLQIEKLTRSSKGRAVMNKKREFAIFFGSIVAAATILSAVRELRGLEAMILTGLLVTVSVIMGLGFAMEKVSWGQRR